MSNHDTTAADHYREQQAEQLLRDAGFVRSPDGTWHPGEE